MAYRRDTNRLIFYYQPIVEIATGEIISAEGPLCWRHPVHGLLSPPPFMGALKHAYNSLKLDA